MAEAARYGNYNADAVVRVIAGRAVRVHTTARPDRTGLPPEAVRRWLEGIDVEQRDLQDYDRMLDEPQAEEQDDDG
jgi:hypothetical protein